MLHPEIDSRKTEDIIDSIKKMVPFYTPEWVFSTDNPDMGSALSLIFAHMLYENIKKLNLVPIKNFAAFANLLNIKVMPPTPAQAFVTFALSEGTRESIFIKKGTQVYAKDEINDEQIIFETANNLLVIPSYPVCIYNVSTKLDRVIPVKNPGQQRSEGNEDISLFDFSNGQNIQEHSLYLGYNDLLNIQSPAIIEIGITYSIKHFKESLMAKILSDTKYVEWSYFSEGSWINFNTTEYENNRVRLIKLGDKLIESNTINGMTNRWVRCRFKIMDEGTVSTYNEIEFDGLGVNVKQYDTDGTQGITPDKVLFNDIQMDPNGFYPFGDIFNMYYTFYFSSQEVLTKKNSVISIKFNLKFIENRMQGDDNSQVNWKLIMKEEDFPKEISSKVSVLNVAWEYWNGTSWVKLFNNREYEEIFYSETDGPREVIFECPSDMAETLVNNEKNYWIRVRVISIKNMFAFGMVYSSPYIEKLTLNYDFKEKKFPFEECITYNNAEYLSSIQYLKSDGKALKPFYCFNTKYPGFYIGFNTAPLKGPISILFSIKPRKIEDGLVPVVNWEYLCKTEYGAEWKNLKVIDTTNSFTESGTIVFAGPHDFGSYSLFGNEAFWVRVLNPDGKYDNDSSIFPVPVVDGIYMNTVEAAQQESIEGEMLQRAGGTNRNEFILSKTPIISEEIWVDETKSLTKSDIINLEKNKGIETDVIKDSEGNPIKCWVKWQCTEDFSESKSDDRHYTIDRSSGTITFGDGRNGMAQPSSGMNTIKANYKTGGGERGILPPYTITELQNPIGFIDRVFNPKASAGGCEKETVEEALGRSTEIIKHRNRAVTAEDFECLTRQASQNIAKVKCLANINEKAERENGCITVVVVPKDKRKERLHFLKLKSQVESYLSDRASNIVSFKQKIRVIQPIYIEVSVSAVLIVNKIDDIISAEKEAVERLNKFLDPFKGNHDSKGWQIGQSIHESAFYPLLKSINFVRNIERVSVAVYKVDDYTREEIRIGDIEAIPHCLITNGSHNVIIKAV